MASDALI